MFFFKKKSSKPPDLSWLNTDMHSHLIPGIDDGAQDMATSLELIRGLADAGYKKLITTPHILWDLYPNTPEIIHQGLEELRQAVEEAEINITLHAAAEYFIDEYFEEQLEKKVPLLTLSENLVLVEFSLLTARLDIQQVLFDMQMQNYQPVIAHPERYIYLDRNREFYDTLKDSGCMFQLNLLSLTGYYGFAVQDLAAYLLKKGYYNLAGTDLHHAKHLATLNKLPSSPLYEELQHAGLINASL